MLVPPPERLRGQPLPVASGITEVPDGHTLNPMLQHWATAIHPPKLNLGYVGFIVPFAFAIGSLIAKETPREPLQ